jgi:hypothetical protein
MIHSLAAPILYQNDYIVHNFNAVLDLNDCGSADYSTTIQCNRYYLHIFKLLVDRVPHTQSRILLAEAGISPTKWKKCFLIRMEVGENFKLLIY